MEVTFTKHTAINHEQIYCLTIPVFTDNSIE